MINPASQLLVLIAYIILKNSSFFIFSEMVTCFNKIAADTECRAVVLSGAGKIFTAGM